MVLVSKRGRRFHAEVLGVEPGSLAIAPFETSARSYRHCSAREVIGHWKRVARRRLPGEPAPRGQLELGFGES